MQRHPQSPILTRRQIPGILPHLVDVSSVFNPGAAFFLGKYRLVLRVQNRGRETFFITAESADGISFTVAPCELRIDGLERVKETIYHCYDARLTVLGGVCYMMFAMDMDGGCRLGLARTADFARFEFLGIVGDGDIRNGVLFPEKVNGKYLRLDRPNRQKHDGGPTSGSVIWLSESDDLLSWRPVAPVLEGRWHYWDELIGPGAPPVKTREGWLNVYHGVATHFAGVNIYQAGVFLLDLADPTKLVARGRQNILEPRELYELAGQVPNVVFPSGMIVEKYDAEGFALPDSRVFVYYGAADTCVGLAVTTIRDLLAAARA
jgi:beta-1,4-mannooligosaccharide/beta-1,4-mannosyl-N-acetylglucosamine phosphorylase